MINVCLAKQVHLSVSAHLCIRRISFKNSDNTRTRIMTEPVLLLLKKTCVQLWRCFLKPSNTLQFGMITCGGTSFYIDFTPPLPPSICSGPLLVGWVSERVSNWRRGGLPSFSSVPWWSGILSHSQWTAEWARGSLHVMTLQCLLPLSSAVPSVPPFSPSLPSRCEDNWNLLRGAGRQASPHHRSK